MSDLQSELAELRSRLTRLEGGGVRQAPRGRTNQAGAARYLGISEETLRQRHARGEGPPRARFGTRNWSYSYVDLDEYAQSGAA